MDGVTLAVADIRVEVAQKAAANFRIAECGGDAASMVETFRPDGIVIATPAHAHLPLAALALRHGVPVLLEKPVAPTSHEAVQLLESEAASSAFVQPGRFAAPPSPAEAARRIDGLLHLAKSPSVHVKISGLYATSDAPATPAYLAAQPFIDASLDRFGPGRCLWGSDFSPALEWVGFEGTFAATCLQRLTPTERDAVMGLNLLKLLHSSPKSRFSPIVRSWSIGPKSGYRFSGNPMLKQRGRAAVGGL